METSLTTFFSAVATISFTVAGFIFLAIAGDGEIRRYWFGNYHRRLLAFASLLVVVLPGWA